MSGHQLQQPAPSRRRLYLALMVTRRTWPCTNELEPSASWMRRAAVRTVALRHFRPAHIPITTV